ncbi:tellurium resistance protein [Vibrio breoganii]|uniref:Tellurium resistance protein n=1 Tax=Vibrio breoganii TaxID=553239 RepID=A0AAN0XXS0_9VIBR|nr:TDT family transporter [Vibrio breoganii]ANO34434.1 tellurium resistance protein [Vibrio breoganii]PMG85204.1 tellurium resistance protein [Vibrio breoganii]PMK44990.1 tellurium resistance protein [Vibrio breoganii]PML00364.1 tellurium resistance protein [Vibrio breoganii]PMO36378.1 tellurium resistance protein [Vibrio breoganii]
MLRKFHRFHHIPPSQAALALGLIGLGQAWALYIPDVGNVIRPYLALIGTLILIPVLLKYTLNPRLFFADIKHPLSGSLMAPMSMALLVLCDYLATEIPDIASVLWFASLGLHITMMVLFFGFQFANFKMVNIVPSWFLYPVGVISSTLAGSELGHNVFSQNMAMLCISIYFLMLPLVLYRLVFFGKLPRRARPTLAIMAAPINLTLAAYLVNFPDPDPILTGALAGIAITMTLLIYLCYINLLRLKFQPSIAAVTFPSVISAIAMSRLTTWFELAHEDWYWLHKFGMFELTIATLLVLWVSAGYVAMYWPERFKPQHKKIKPQ